MTYEISELMEVGEAGSTIQAEKPLFIDEVAGATGPNQPELEAE
jgi:hypothetical protein